MKTYIFLLVVAVSLAGCIPFKTSIDQQAMPDFSRVLVVSRLPVNKPKMLYDFIKVFPVQYSVCSMGIDPLTFGNPDSLVRQRIRECNSQVVLTIDIQSDYGVLPNSYSRTSPGHYPPPPAGLYSGLRYGTLYFEMYDVATGKSFWKGIGNQYATNHGVYARKVAKRLRDDKIILGHIPVLNPPSEVPKYQ